MSEATTLRRRHDAIKNTLDQERPAPSRGNESWLLQVTTISGTIFPTTALAGFPVVKVIPGGLESVGATPTFNPIVSPFVAFNTGVGIPAINQYVIGIMASGRWVFNFNG